MIEFPVAQVEERMNSLNEARVPWSRWAWVPIPVLFAVALLSAWEGQTPYESP